MLGVSFTCVVLKPRARLKQHQERLKIEREIWPNCMHITFYLVHIRAMADMKLLPSLHRYSARFPSLDRSLTTPAAVLTRGTLCPRSKEPHF